MTYSYIQEWPISTSFQTDSINLPKKNQNEVASFCASHLVARACCGTQEVFESSSCRLLWWHLDGSKGHLQVDFEYRYRF